MQMLKLPPNEPALFTNERSEVRECAMVCGVDAGNSAYKNQLFANKTKQKVGFSIASELFLNNSG